MQLRATTEIITRRINSTTGLMQFKPDACFSDRFDLQIITVGEIECDLIPHLTHSQNPRTSKLFPSDPLAGNYMQEMRLVWEYFCCWKGETSSTETQQVMLSHHMQAAWHGVMGVIEAWHFLWPLFVCWNKESFAFLLSPTLRWPQCSERFRFLRKLFDCLHSNFSPQGQRAITFHQA